MAWRLLFALLCPITAAEASRESFPDRAARLRAWVTERGGYVNLKVHAVEEALGSDEAGGESGRGLIAGEDIIAGERLIFVPQAALVSIATAERDPFCQDIRRILVEERERCVSCAVRDPTCRRACNVISEATEEAVEQTMLAAWIAKEWANPETSPWQPWLELLPADFGGSLLMLSESQLRAALPGTELLKEVLQRQAAWRIADEVLANKSNAYRDHVPSFAAFAASRLVVLSRVHGLGGAGVGGLRDAVVPFADLLNHDPDAPTIWGAESGGEGFLLTAAAPISAGTPITCSYGQERSNEELFLHYGFVLPENPAHAVSLPLTLSRARDDPLQGAKRDVLLSMDLYRTFQFSELKGFAASGAPLRIGEPLRFAEGEPSRDVTMFLELLSYLRVAAMDYDDVEAHPHLQAIFAEGDEDAMERLRARHAVLDARLEARAARRLVAACDEAIGLLGEARPAVDVLGEMQSITVDASGAVEQDDSGQSPRDLSCVARASTHYLGLERRLYALIRELALTIEKLVEAGTWPVGGEEGHGDAQKYIDMWKRSYQEGVASAA